VVTLRDEENYDSKSWTAGLWNEIRKLEGEFGTSFSGRRLHDI